MFSKSPWKRYLIVTLLCLSLVALSSCEIWWDDDDDDNDDNDYDCPILGRLGLAAPQQTLVIPLQG